MAIRTQHQLTEQIWFITFTCYKWLPLFEITKSYDLIYNWLVFIREKHNIETFAFVIMPNHVHLLLYIPDDKINLNKLMANAKRFIAYGLVKKLQETGNEQLLITLTNACSEKEKAKGQLHKIFEPSFDAKPVYSTAFWEQKLDYIHNNPVSGKWSLCAEYTNYPHSSASFYIDGVIHPDVDITNYYSKWDR
ncbi:transposase [Mucilaginibacter sp. AW1-3]